MCSVKKITSCIKCGSTKLEFQKNLPRVKCLNCNTWHNLYIPINKKHESIETAQAYNNLAHTIATTNESIEIIEIYKELPLHKFLEEVCGCNGIRFRTDYHRKYNKE